MLSVREGVGDGHKRSILAGNKTVEASHAFCIVADHSSLDLEAASAKEREKWVATFQTLLTVFRTNPASPSAASCARQGGGGGSGAAKRRP